MSEGTRSEDYSATYYNDAHLGGYDNYTWDNEVWRAFFLSLADRIVGIEAHRTRLSLENESLRDDQARVRAEGLERLLG